MKKRVVKRPRNPPGPDPIDFLRYHSTSPTPALLRSPIPLRPSATKGPKILDLHSRQSSPLDLCSPPVFLSPLPPPTKPVTPTPPPVPETIPVPATAPKPAIPTAMDMLHFLYDGINNNSLARTILL